MRRPAAALLAAAALVAVPSAGAVSGPLTVLVLPVAWGSGPEPPTGVQQLADGAARFLTAASYGQLTVQPTVTPWLHLPGPPPLCTDLRAIHDAAAVAAASAGYDAERFSRRIYVIPYDAVSCHTDGPLAYTVGRDIVDAGLFRPETLAHELGHTLGLGHAWRRTCTPTCVVREYGDPLDAMAFGAGDFNPLEKALAGWLPAPAVARGDGNYVVDEFETPSRLPQALVVPTGRGEYWIDHRERLGNDTALAIPLGIEVRLRERAVLGESLILTPSELVSDPHDLNGGAVPVGRTFTVARVFSVTVLDRAGTHVDLRFRWLDRTAPAPAAPKAPATAPAGLRLAWTAAADRGSGVDHYDVFLDGRALAPASGTSEVVARPSAGGHTLGVVAVDRAGNRGRLATRRFVLR